MGNKQGKNAKPGKASAVSQPNTVKENAATGFDSGMTVDDFIMLNVVGKGSFGKVIQVKKKDTGKIYAMKVLKKSLLLKRKQIKHTETERKILQRITHPFVVSLQFSFQTETKLYMVLDYFTGGELFFHLKSGGSFGEERARFYAAEIALAIACLHENGYIYRDLKPENVLLDDAGHIKLTDFGLSKDGVADGGVTHTFCGTPEYLAPEVISGKPYGKVVDWWSLGTLLYEMIHGLPPFYSNNLHVMYDKILKGKLVFPDTMSKEARDVLTRLLDRNPATRLGANGIEEIRDHPFFASIDWVKLYNLEVTPTFVPTTTEGKMDTTNIDEEFKSETPKDTPVFSVMAKDVNFEGFTFANPEAADGLNADEDGSDMYN